MRGGGRETGSSHDDVLLSRLYQQVTDVVEPRFGAGYDLAGGLERYTAWLREHTEGPALDPVPVEWSADHAVIELYSTHYRALVRLAAMLLRDTPTAEEVVQDSFVAMHAGWDRLRDTEKALAYLRQAVVNRSRSVLRHRTVVEKNVQPALPDMPSAEHGAFVLMERSAVVAALRHLPQRQREAIVLRYYADLSEADIAATMGISQGAVKSHTSRAIAALRAALEQELWREPGLTPRACRPSGITSPSSSAVRCTPPRTRSSRRKMALSRFAPRSLWDRAGPPVPRRGDAGIAGEAGVTRAATAHEVLIGTRATGTGTRDGASTRLVREKKRGSRSLGGTFLGTAAGPTYYGRYDRAG
jgi:RNA polymerase sigma-70 factor (sigma-E family)